MNLLWCCFVTAVVSTVCNAALDVERTVQQVQSILKTNSLLPRLTREEIIQLLNDIRAEDAKSKSSSTELSRETSSEFKTTPYTPTTTPYNTNDNEVNVNQLPDIQDNIVADEKEYAVSVTAPTPTFETTTKSEPSVMVVLPYTPRDGASLQELYTRPPRVEVVPESKVTPKPLTVKSNERLQETLRKNAEFANKQKLDFPAELQAFLDSHGLKGKPGQDHFLLPLEGFKPLPPARVVDGSVQLPENILLSYDLISPSSDSKTSSNNNRLQSLSPNNFLYEPLRPEFPFELDTSSTEQKHSVLPLDLPKRRTTKSTPKKPNYEPIDYDSVKVIPLNQGPNPLEDERVVLETGLDKRQTNITVEIESSSTVSEDTTTTTTPATELKDAITNAPPKDDSVPDSDLGASITDLEESFGGAAPVEPGDSELPPPRKNGFYWMLDWNSFLEVGDGDTKVNIRLEPKLGDPQMFLPVSVP